MATATDQDSDDEGGPLARWTQSAMANPEKVYRALFYAAMVFFLVTTMFPFYWLLVLAVTPEGNLLAGSSCPRSPGSRSRSRRRRGSIREHLSPSSNRCRSTCTC